MDHDEAQALLELAAAEPDGFERLAAGDTPEAAALAGHLAGCSSCAAEVEVLGRVSTTLRSVIRELPRPELRSRTLAYVAATGRPRGAAMSVATTGRDASAKPGAGAAPPSPADEGTAALARSGAAPQRSWWPAIAAAAVLVAALGLVGWRATDAALDAERHRSEGLATVAQAAFRVGSQPDAQRVALTGTSGTGQEKGELSFSIASSELVVVADGLPTPPDGMEYRCWVERDGVRARIGRMYEGGGLSYWSGRSEKVASLVPGARFGVSLEPYDGGGSGEPVLFGEL